MSGWDDPKIVSERLIPALKSHGIITSEVIISSAVTPLCDHSGLSGEMSILTITLDHDNGGKEEASSTIKFILKRTRPTDEGKATSQRLGLHREATFYKTIAPWLEERLDKIPSSSNTTKRSFIPKTYFAESDSTTGQKAIVLKYYENATEAGESYPHSIHNLGRELTVIESDDNCNSARAVTLEATRMAAFLHGAFYKDTSLLLDNPTISSHLRMADWIQGKGRESFLLSQQEVCDRWKCAKEKWSCESISSSKQEGEVVMEKKFVDIMDVSCAKALHFDSFVAKWSDTPDGSVESSKIGWSLVHGDYHPGNILCLNNASDGKKELSMQHPNLILLDWEVVGVGSGPQDIGQYLISHLETEEAHGMLDEITCTYRQTLVETIDATANATLRTSEEVPSSVDLKREIIHGGLERWIWLFGYMCGMEIPAIYMQFFHDQVYGWIVANNILAEHVGMPRP